MARLAASVLVLAVTLLATAADPPKGLDFPPEIVNCKLRGDELIFTTFEQVPVAVELDVLVEKNGKKVTEKRVVTEHRLVPLQKTALLKDLKATDGSGKPIPAARLAILLEDETPVVFHTGPLAAKYRGLFRDATVLIEFPPVPLNMVPEKMVAPAAPKPLPTKSKE